MAIISRIAQMVRRSMTQFVVKGRGRTRPDGTDDSGLGGEQRASFL
jgi:hypothetical protein